MLNTIKKTIIISALFFGLFPWNLELGTCSAQGTWTQMANFGGGARMGAVGFSIGAKGYIGTGASGNAPSWIFRNDFWEWDQTTNVWTQKADFGGTTRRYASGFSISTKGYIGMGGNAGGYKQDFWEWDGDLASPTYNTWTKKADFGGARGLPVGFSIGTKGYIGTGSDAGGRKNDFWEWNQATNTWTQKANFGGTARTAASGFSIGTKGYIGTGSEAGGVLTQDFWEWDGDLASPTYNTWTKKANFGGTPRFAAVGFSIGTKGYIGTGSGGIPDFWEWDQTTNVWTQKANFGGTSRWYAVGFSIGSCGYIGTGYVSLQDFWEWSPGASCSGSLPVELLFFTAALTAENHVLCSWATASESNNSHFDVERSRDGVNFEKFGKVDGAPGGNSSITLYYVYYDHEPYNGVSYYRLKQVDFNGQYEYSPVRAVYIGTIEIISIYPNPASEYIEYLLGSAEGGAVTVTLYDALGREVYNKEETIEAGLFKERIETQNFASGNYLLRITNGSKEKTQKQLVIK